MNQDLRIRHADDPEKFLKSEVDLDEEVKKVQQLAAAPELYGQFVNEGGVKLLSGLLNHTNTDIASGVLGTLSELTGLFNRSRGGQRQAGSQTSEGSFLAVSTPIFTNRYSFESS